MTKQTKTCISNSSLKHCQKALQTLIYYHEEGQATLEAGTYQAFKRTEGVVSSEIEKQKKVKKGANLTFHHDPEVQQFQRENGGGWQG
tara:strand:+ start:428 stop:691 length:264 start_codon:yes stop_codon:yes gene_type:complete